MPSPKYLSIWSSDIESLYLVLYASLGLWVRRARIEALLKNPKFSGLFGSCNHVDCTLCA